MGVKGQKIAQNEKEQLHLSHAISQEQYSIWSWFLVQFCKMMISLGIVFIYLKFSFRLLEGQKGKKLPKMKNSNCICHAPYLKNSIAYNHDFWCTCVKWWYWGVFFIFWAFFFFGGGGGRKREKNGPRWQKNLSVAVDISGTIYHMIVIFGTPV